MCQCLEYIKISGLLAVSISNYWLSIIVLAKVVLSYLFRIFIFGLLLITFSCNANMTCTELYIDIVYHVVIQK